MHMDDLKASSVVSFMLFWTWQAVLPASVSVAFVCLRLFSARCWLRRSTFLHISLSFRFTSTGTCLLSSAHPLLLHQYVHPWQCALIRCPLPHSRVSIMVSKVPKSGEGFGRTNDAGRRRLLIVLQPKQYNNQVYKQKAILWSKQCHYQRVVLFDGYYIEV